MKSKIDKVNAIEDKIQQDKQAKKDKRQNNAVTNSNKLENIKMIKRVRLDRDLVVEVVNNVEGTLIWENPRTKALLTLDDYGEVAYMTVEELYQLKQSSDSGILTKGWLLIMNEDLVDELGLTQKYKNLFIGEDLNYIFENSSGQAIYELLKSLDVQSAMLICERAVALARNKDVILDSADVRSAIMKYCKKTTIFDFDSEEIED